MDLISIHAPREGGDQEITDAGYLTDDISIHAPREGGDESRNSQFAITLISIHAPREGGDAAAEKRKSRRPDFNPRPPRGGRRNWRVRP